MPLTSGQIVQAVRAAWLSRFSARKLERWGNLGVVPHATRKGKGKGKGWEFLWPDDALWIALYIADAFGWQESRRFEDAVLWAWLRGAPIRLPVVRRFLAESFRRQQSWLNKHLQRHRRNEDEEPLDLVDRLARVFSHRHDTLRAMNVPVDVRLGAMRETLAQLIGERWSSSTEAYPTYATAWNAISGPLGIAWDTSPQEATRQQKFFQYRNLERIVRSVKDGDLLAARDSFAVPFLEVSSVVDKIQSGRRVTAEQKASAEATYRIFSVLFQMDPAWVAALFLHPVVHRASKGRDPKS